MTKCYWKCKGCNAIFEKNISPGTGYCPYCKEHFMLERYDPLSFEGEGIILSPIVLYRCEDCQKPFKKEELRSGTYCPKCRTEGAVKPFKNPKGQVLLEFELVDKLHYQIERLTWHLTGQPLQDRKEWEALWEQWKTATKSVFEETEGI